MPILFSSQSLNDAGTCRSGLRLTHLAIWSEVRRYSLPPRAYRTVSLPGASCHQPLMSCRSYLLLLGFFIMRRSLLIVRCDDDTEGSQSRFRRHVSWRIHFLLCITAIRFDAFLLVKLAPFIAPITCPAYLAATPPLGNRLSIAVTRGDRRVEDRLAGLPRRMLMYGKRANLPKSGMDRGPRRRPGYSFKHSISRGSRTFSKVFVHYLLTRAPVPAGGFPRR